MTYISSMKYKSLDFTSDIDTTRVDLQLSLGDLKILHNACVDIVRRHPDMISYANLIPVLGMVIDDHVYSAEHDLPF